MGSKEPGTIGATFSSVCFGASLSYLGYKLATGDYNMSPEPFLAAIAFIKLVDSWWWYFYVLDEAKPTRSIAEWYAEFGFSLALFLLVASAESFNRWCWMFILCNLIGCTRVRLATGGRHVNPVLRRVGLWLAWFGGFGIALLSASLLMYRLTPTSRWPYVLAGICGAGHLCVTFAAWVRLPRHHAQRTENADKVPPSQPDSTGNGSSRSFWTVVPTLVTVLMAAFTAWMAWETRSVAKGTALSNNLNIRLARSAWHPQIDVTCLTRIVQMDSNPMIGKWNGMVKFQVKNRDVTPVWLRVAHPLLTDSDGSAADEIKRHYGFSPWLITQVSPGESAYRTMPVEDTRPDSAEGRYLHLFSATQALGRSTLHFYEFVYDASWAADTPAVLTFALRRTYTGVVERDSILLDSW